MRQDVIIKNKYILNKVLESNEFLIKNHYLFVKIKDNNLRLELLFNIECTKILEFFYNIENLLSIMMASTPAVASSTRNIENFTSLMESILVLASSSENTKNLLLVMKSSLVGASSTKDVENLLSTIKFVSTVVLNTNFEEYSAPSIWSILAFGIFCIEVLILLHTCL